MTPDSAAALVAKLKEAAERGGPAWERAYIALAVNSIGLVLEALDRANDDLLAVADSIERGQLVDMRASGGSLPHHLRARAGKNAEALAAVAAAAKEALK